MKTNDENNDLNTESKMQENEGQANFINGKGNKFYPHEFIFEEDIPELIKYVKE